MSNHSEFVATQTDVRTLQRSEVFYQAQKLAWDKIHGECKPPEELLLFCVNIDSCWQGLAAALLAVQTQGSAHKPSDVVFVWGCTDSSFYDFLTSNHFLRQIDVDSIRNMNVSSGRVKLLVFDEGEVDIREILPKSPVPLI